MTALQYVTANFYKSGEKKIVAKFCPGDFNGLRNVSELCCGDMRKGMRDDLCEKCWAQEADPGEAN